VLVKVRIIGTHLRFIDIPPIHAFILNIHLGLRINVEEILRGLSLHQFISKPYPIINQAKASFPGAD